MNGFDLEGVEEMISKLDYMDDRVNRGMNAVLKKAAEPLKSQIETNVNRSELVHHHAKDDVTISRIRMESGDRGSKYVQVGYENVGWRMWFVEFGTYSKSAGGKGITPQHNVTHAIMEAEPEVNEIRKYELQKLIFNN